MLNEFRKVATVVLACLIFISGINFIALSAEAEGVKDEPAEVEETIIDDVDLSDEDASKSGETEDTGLKLTLKIAQAYHEGYISGYDDGTFRPDNKVTRAEAAQMIYGLLESTPEDRVEFTDVAETDWYYDSIGLLAAGGILDYNGTRVGPNAYITRGQFASMVANFFPDPEEELTVSPYSDVNEDTKYYSEILKASYYGYISGYDDGTFRPEDNVTRADAVTVINKVIGRAASNNYTSTLILPMFSDVPSSYWAYTAIMEASVSHTFVATSGESENWTWIQNEPLKREPGFLFVGLDYYYISPETGFPVTDTAIGGLYFGADGKYTSGDAEIDEYVKETLEGIVTENMTQEEKLKAAYIYTRDSFTYLKRHYYKIGDTGWELEEARTMFSTKRGNCYCYASVFYYLSRQLGYDSTIISGTVGHSASPHGWVEITFDDTVYIFDTELEMAYRKKGVYYYDFYKMPYSAIPWPYKK